MAAPNTKIILTLRGGVDILVATPGRMLDLIDQKALRLDQIEVFVVDEADRMLDMGFAPDIRKIAPMLPQTRQALFFSATMPKEVAALARELLKDPVRVDVSPKQMTVKEIDQRVVMVDNGDKQRMLEHLLRADEVSRAIVFTRTKHGANKVARKLENAGIVAEAIHGNKSPGARTRALADFKAGVVRVLVATDLAARGLDIDRLPHVVNFELPNVPEDYIHRIGRTARAGEEGHAISLVCVDEQPLLRDIERLLKCKIEIEIIPGYEPDPRIKAEPIRNGRSQRPSGKRSGSRKNVRSGAPKVGSRPRRRSSGRQPRVV